MTCWPKTALLLPEEYQTIDWGGTPDCVDYGRLYELRYPVLHKATARLLANPPADYRQFCEENAFWLPDYALFMALKDAHSGAAWGEWEPELIRRDPEALAERAPAMPTPSSSGKPCSICSSGSGRLSKPIANEKGIQIIGDLPIYVAADSVDVWSSPQEFQLDETLFPPKWPAARRTLFPPPASFGATRCMIGTPCAKPDMPGGCGASGTCAVSTTLYELTTSAALRVTTQSRSAAPTPATVAGAKARELSCSKQSKESLANGTSCRRSRLFDR